MAWLLPKSKPNPLHPYVLSHISHASLWILLCASNSSPGCPSGLPWQFFPVFPSFILLSPCLGWNLGPSQIQHSPCGFFFNGFIKMSTGPGAARDQHFCASMMALLHSYVPPHSLKYMCVIRPSVSPPSGYQLKVFISSSLPLKNLAQIHHLLFHSCCWRLFRQCYNHVTQCHLSSGFGLLPKSASISN